MAGDVHPLDLLTEWTEALLAERDYDRKHLAELLAGSSLKVRRSEGVTWSPVEVTAASYAFGGAKWTLKCKEGGGLLEFSGWEARFCSPVGDHKVVEEWGTACEVMKMRGMDMDVVLEGDGPEGVAIQHMSWTVDARADERSYQAMAHALSHWVNVDGDEAKAFETLPWARAIGQHPRPRTR